MELPDSSIAKNGDDVKKASYRTGKAGLYDTGNAHNTRSDKSLSDNIANNAQNVNKDSGNCGNCIRRGNRKVAMARVGKKTNLWYNSYCLVLSPSSILPR
jgi:hypothetical protein